MSHFLLTTISFLFHLIHTKTLAYKIFKNPKNSKKFLNSKKLSLEKLLS